MITATIEMEVIRPQWDALDAPLKEEVEQVRLRKSQRWQARVPKWMQQSRRRKRQVKATSTTRPQDKRSFLERLRDEDTDTPEQKAELEAETLARFQTFRQELLHNALTSTEVAQRLGISSSAVEKRTKKNALLGVEDEGRLRFPPWQFDGKHIVDGLPDVLRALQVSPLAKASWLSSVSPYLEGRTPLQMVRAGETERVVQLARAVGAV